MSSENEITSVTERKMEDRKRHRFEWEDYSFTSAQVRCEMVVKRLGWKSSREVKYRTREEWQAEDWIIDLKIIMAYYLNSEVFSIEKRTEKPRKTD